MLEELFHKIIYGHPYIKKNNQRTIYHKYLKRPIVIYSNNYLTWEKDALKQLGLSRNGSWIKNGNPKAIDFPIILKCHFYCQDKRRRDLSACLEGIQDVLVKAGVLLDDNSKILIGHDGSRVFYDKENPRTEFWILK
jgi:Holliday junction resolvase RusA-like endonuclease